VTQRVELRRGAYRDSVTLMQVSRAVTDTDGVDAALVAMATELNLDLLTGMGFEAPADAGPNDMVVAVRAVDDDRLAAGLAAMEAALAAQPDRAGGAGLGGRRAPRTTGVAARLSGGTVALISVPGQHAFTEAMDALDAGLSVMLFSDNVPVEQEIRLKDAAAGRDLLVMGPDCGTAVVGGVGLGFANAVRPGPVGIVAASGTGAQQLMGMLEQSDVGVSHCLGVGGRDLSAAVAARSTKQALAMLDADPATELILVVSKPPDPAVAAAVAAYAQTLRTPVILGLLGPGQDDITALAHRAVDALGREWTEPFSWDGMPPPRGGSALRGLFAGGTLCDEAMVIASASLGPVRSNIPLHPEWAVGADLRDPGHLMLDFGDDALTQGRPHPMIDQRSRVERIAVEGADPTCRVLLLDVVLGYGAHPDPASELAPAIAAAREQARGTGRELAVVVSLCACHDDPQVRRTQAERLREAGASIYLSNAAAARRAVELVTGADQ
jgi:FdrA protein